MTLRASLAGIVEGLRAGPARAEHELRLQVEDHLALVRLAAANDPFVDLDQAERVTAGCRALLDRWPHLDPAARALIQAACLYFADSRDHEDDLASIVGFDDDLEVLHHVMEILRR